MDVWQTPEGWEIAGKIGLWATAVVTTVLSFLLSLFVMWLRDRVREKNRERRALLETLQEIGGLAQQIQATWDRQNRRMMLLCPLFEELSAIGYKRANGLPGPVAEKMSNFMQHFEQWTKESAWSEGHSLFPWILNDLRELNEACTSAAKALP